MKMLFKRLVGNKFSVSNGEKKMTEMIASSSWTLSKPELLSE